MFNNAEGWGWGRGRGFSWSRDVMLFLMSLYFNTELILISCGLCSLWCHWGVVSGHHWLVTVNMTFRLLLSTSLFFKSALQQSYGALGHAKHIHTPKISRPQQKCPLHIFTSFDQSGSVDTWQFTVILLRTTLHYSNQQNIYLLISYKLFNSLWVSLIKSDIF